MYDLATRKALARRYADLAHIPAYRQMLREMNRPCARRIGMDGARLAESLFYTLLGCCSVETILQRLAVSAEQFPEATKKPSPPEGSPRAKMSKAEEYPCIDWRNLDDPLVRMADSIYSDRINCWRRLKELEAGTREDSAPREVLAEIVELTIRHELCFQELRNFNDKGAFLGMHPFITQKDEREHVRQLLLSYPDAYFEERKNIELNISRYSSQINGKKASGEAKARARENLERHQARLALYKEVFREFTSAK